MKSGLKGGVCDLAGVLSPLAVRSQSSLGYGLCTATHLAEYSHDEMSSPPISVRQSSMMEKEAGARELVRLERSCGPTTNAQRMWAC